MNITANRRNILSNLGWSVLGKVVSLSGSLLVGLLTYVVLSIVIAMVFIDKSTNKEVGNHIISFRQRIILQVYVVEMLFILIACLLFLLVKSRIIRS